MMTQIKSCVWPIRYLQKDRNIYDHRDHNFETDCGFSECTIKKHHKNKHHAKFHLKIMNILE